MKRLLDILAENKDMPAERDIILVLLDFFLDQNAVDAFCNKVNDEETETEINARLWSRVLYYYELYPCSEAWTQFNEIETIKYKDDSDDNDDNDDSDDNALSTLYAILTSVKNPRSLSSAGITLEMMKIALSL